MKVVLFALLLSVSAAAQNGWKDSILIKTEPINGWCKHCPDWNQTAYSFKLDDGTIYTVRTHARLDVAINGHAKLRFDSGDHIGDSLHVVDGRGKDRKLVIASKEVK